MVRCRGYRHDLLLKQGNLPSPRVVEIRRASVGLPLAVSKRLYLIRLSGLKMRDAVLCTLSCGPFLTRFSPLRPPDAVSHSRSLHISPLLNEPERVVWLRSTCAYVLRTVLRSFALVIKLGHLCERTPPPRKGAALDGDGPLRRFPSRALSPRPEAR